MLAHARLGASYALEVDGPPRLLFGTSESHFIDQRDRTDIAMELGAISTVVEVCHHPIHDARLALGQIFAGVMKLPSLPFPPLPYPTDSEARDLRLVAPRRHQQFRLVSCQVGTSDARPRESRPYQDGTVPFDWEEPTSEVSPGLLPLFLAGLVSFITLGDSQISSSILSTVEHPGTCGESRGEMDRREVDSRTKNRDHPSRAAFPGCAPHTRTPRSPSIRSTAFTHASHRSTCQRWERSIGLALSGEQLDRTALSSPSTSLPPAVNVARAMIPDRPVRHS